MLRRIAITTAAVAAAGVMAATPAFAGGKGGSDAVEFAANYYQVEGVRTHGNFLNLGGPYGITYAREHTARLDLEGGSVEGKYQHRD